MNPPSPSCVRAAKAVSVVLLFGLVAGCGGSGDDAKPKPPETPKVSGLSLLAGVADGWGYQDGPAALARLASPSALSSTPQGDTLIVEGNAIRRLSADGKLTTIAGVAWLPVPEGAAGGTWIDKIPMYVDGPAATARFNAPSQAVADPLGNVYVADTGNQVVRKIDLAGNVSTLAGQAGVCGTADGKAGSATLCNPTGIAVDGQGNLFVSGSVSGDPVQVGSRYVQYSFANPIRKIAPDGTVTTVTSKVSDYPSAFFFSSTGSLNYRPAALAVDATGVLYAADQDNEVIRRYLPDGTSEVFSGAVTLPTPPEVTTDNSGYVDGAAKDAKFSFVTVNARPPSLSIDGAGQLWVLARKRSANGDAQTTTLRRVAPDGAVSTAAVWADCVSMNMPEPASPTCWTPAMALQSDGRVLALQTRGVYGDNASQVSMLYSYGPDGTASRVLGAPVQAGSADGVGEQARFRGAGVLMAGRTGALYVLDADPAPSSKVSLRSVSATGMVTTQTTVEDGSFGGWPTMDATDNVYSLRGHTVIKRTPAGVITTIADLGPILDAVPTGEVSSVSGLAAGDDGTVYAATSKGAIFRINPKGEVTLWAGSLGAVGHADGKGSAAKFGWTGALTLDAQNNLYVVDAGSYASGVGSSVRKITPDGVVTTMAGQPSAVPSDMDLSGGPWLGFPSLLARTSTVAVDARGRVYVADPARSVIYQIGLDGQIHTLAGQAGQKGFAPGALPGVVNRPSSLAVIGQTLYAAMPHAIVQVGLP